MCYSSYREAVETEVRCRVEAQEMFTAWDITCAVRAQGIVESHQVLKEVVHCLHRYGQMGDDYERTFIAVGNEPKQAFLYHHISDDPCDYGLSPDSSDDKYDLAKLVPTARRGLLDTLLNRVISGVTASRRA
ncbi:MAG: hypothetical protein V4671_04195 [Armatimonadota bacterium]